MAKNIKETVTYINLLEEKNQLWRWLGLRQKGN